MDCYGHPRKLTYEKLIGSVSRSRPATNVDVATGERTFQTVTLTKAVYGTGWDGTIVLEADAQGNWRVDDRAPTPGVVNLNTATVEELITLPMIGHKRADAIVKYRDQNGPFQGVDELTKISGIKSGTVEALRELVKTE